MGLRPFHWLSHERILILLFVNHYFCKFPCMFGVIILLKDPLAKAVKFSCARKQLLLQYLRAHGTIHFSINDVKFPCTMDSKTEPHHDAASSMIDGRDGILGIIGSPWFSPDIKSFVSAEKLNFAFIGPYNSFPKLNCFVKMVFGKR